MKTANETNATLGTCWKCLGHGYFSCWQHIAGGVCLACNGEGVKLYASRDIRGAGFSVAPRAVQITVIRQALLLIAECKTDEFLAKNAYAPGAIVEIVASVLAHADADVKARALAALEAAGVGPRAMRRLRRAGEVAKAA